MTKTTITPADRDAGNRAFDIAFQGNTETIDDDMAALFAAHREAERGAIVKWLYAQAGIAAVKAEKAVAPPENERLARDLFAAKISLERAAEAIERGEHHD